MSNAYKVLILGASYGSLLGTKMALAGHHVTLVCLPEEARPIAEQGTIVRIPVRGRDGLVEVRSKDAPGSLTAVTPAEADPAAFDLTALAMQEPQYRAPEIRDLLSRIGVAQKPVMSIMNMPPLPYLLRLPKLNAKMLEPCFTDASVWDPIDPSMMTLASPDPQAFRPPEEKLNVLQVSLPTNFKVAAFENDAHTQILREIQADIEAVTHDPGDGTPIPLPVKLKVHDSIYVPLAKWSMLLTGNYRCVTEGDARPICEAVHDDLDVSRQVYEWVGQVCQKLGADAGDLVPFEKYANASKGLAKPSSAARALYAGASAIERVDLLVHIVASSLGLSHDSVTRTVELVDAHLKANREKAA